MSLKRFNEMAKERIEPQSVKVDTIGDLKNVIKNLPDDMWVGVTTTGDGFTSYHAYIGVVGDYPDKKSLIFCL